jgi:tetratricopeptide (TPR) repeat protein
LHDAARSAEAAIIIAERHAKLLTFEREGYKGLLADALFQAGSFDRAAIIFQEAETLLRQRQPSHQFLYSLHGFLYCDFLLHEAEQASWRSYLRLGQPDRPIRSLTELEDRSARVLFASIFEKAAGRRDVGLQQLILCRASLFRSLLQQSRDKMPNALDSVYSDSGQLTEAIRAAKEYVEALPGFHARALSRSIGKAELDVNDTLEAMRAAGDLAEVPRGLLTRAWLQFLENDSVGACADLDEAWDIAERGPMRLHLADIHLHRARLFFREKRYPWKSPQDDLATAEKLINDCGYHRRDEELADAKRAILGS